jgi:hypothetical protein
MLQSNNSAYTTVRCWSCHVLGVKHIHHSFFQLSNWSDGPTAAEMDGYVCVGGDNIDDFNLQA